MFAQAPQLVLFVETVSSQPSSAPVAGKLQLANPSVQVELHTPLLQARESTFCVPHARPQAPQLPMSVCSDTSQPFGAAPSQLAQPLLHDAMLQTPPVQAAVACANEQAFGQLPQWAMSVFRLDSQPFATFPSQLPNPALHPAIWQTPVVHEPVAFAGLHA